MKISKKKIVLALAVLFAVFFAACSDDSGSGTGAGFASEEDDPSSYIAEKIVPIKNKTISGYAQKGPFMAGSIVDIYELELDGKTFAQTGKSFTGKVANDKGEFKIPNVSLKSQYALLKVTGYFTSEINGEGVRATLTAVTDLSKRENVNVNILTHLEYDRVLALLGKGMNFTSAKKQAGREVLAAFGIGLEENAAAEDLNVSGESDADAALVAISKLLLAGEEKGTNRNEEDLSGLLAKIAGSIGENGTWSAPRWIALNIRRLNDWNGRECSFPYNTKEGKYLYQLYISSFYTGKYCTSSLDGEIVYVNSDAFVNTRDSLDGRGTCVGHRYFCKDGEWRYVGRFLRGGYTDLCNNVTEEEHSNFGDGKDGDIRMGNITGVSYKYDEIEDKWLEISVFDTLVFVCTEKRVGKCVGNNDSIYCCGVYTVDEKKNDSCPEYTTGVVFGRPECQGMVILRRTKVTLLDSLFFVSGAAYAGNPMINRGTCVSNIIDDKKMEFTYGGYGWNVYTIFYDNSGFHLDSLYMDSLYLKLDNLGLLSRGEPMLISEDGLELGGFFHPNCSALRDSLQQKYSLENSLIE